MMIPEWWSRDHFDHSKSSFGCFPKIGGPVFPQNGWFISPYFILKIRFFNGMIWGYHWWPHFRHQNPNLDLWRLGRSSCEILTSEFWNAWKCYGKCLGFFQGCTLPETNSSHLKMDGWNTIVSFWDGLFSVAMLVFGSVVWISHVIDFLGGLGW